MHCLAKKGKRDARQQGKRVPSDARPYDDSLLGSNLELTTLKFA